MSKKGMIGIAAAAGVAFITSISVLCYNEYVTVAGNGGSHYESTLDKKLIFKDYSLSDWANGGIFNCVFTPNNVQFENGVMRLAIDKNSNGYTGAEYASDDYYGFGLFQVRMKPIKNDGVITSFFTYTGPSDGTDWSEIDIEFLGNDTTKVQFNYYNKDNEGHEFLYDLGFDASEEFHTYAFCWSTNAIRWFVDGEEAYVANYNVPQIPGKVMMDVWPARDSDNWVGEYDGTTPLYAYYDWFSYDRVNSDDEVEKLLKASLK
jgi:beta-glucanase (GH16 family)